MSFLARLGLGRRPEDPRVEALGEQEAGLLAVLKEAEATLAELELENGILLEAARALKPGMGLQAAGSALLDLIREPLGIATYFIARVDWEADVTDFPIFLEGGRLRRHPLQPYSGRKGLTGLAIEKREPIYVRALDPEGIAMGAILSRAEAATGLIPQTWFGVPLARPDLDGGRPFGLVAFQVFPEDGFSPRRRELLERLARLLALTYGAP
ncbi:MAG TPA: GAF domain-containing protein [Holophagaceae bacterium]|nr:GAF domain-containing protein [Holophagaceae bacterium]